MDITELYSLYLQHPQVSTDTRKISPGSIFFALSGDKFDGNAFAHMALQQGAAYAVVSDPLLKGDQYVFVENTLTTLQELARHHRRQLKIPVIAITGSNGKTTTKELISAVLAEKFRIHATAGNLNNHIGVPLTLLGASPATELIVCEMGANHPGEIGFLCTLAEPTHGIITNIGKAHLEGFGSLEGVKKAKGELFDFLKRHEGLCFINNDDPRLRDLSLSIHHKITYGFDEAYHPDILFSYQADQDGTGFTIRGSGLDAVTIHSGMFGHYNATNLLAAYTIGKQFGIDQKLMQKTLGAFIPGANRSEVVRYQGATIIKDAYNANPSSMELAIRAFAEQYPNGWIVLGDMKEVGVISTEAHRQMIDLARSLHIERIYLAGPEFEAALTSQDNSDPRIHFARDVEEMKKQWDWTSCQGKSILLKGSRSMRLEQLLES